MCAHVSGCMSVCVHLCVCVCVCVCGGLTMFLILFSLLCNGTKFYWNAWANRKVLGSDLNRENAGTFLGGWQ